jgi:thioredoxin 1
MVVSVSEKNFSQEVLDSSIPVLVSFWAPWCSVCRIVNPFLQRFQAELDTPVKIVSINADDNFRLSNSYRLTTLPTLLLFDEGKVIQRLDRFHSRDDLRLAAEQLQGKLKTVEVNYSYTA